MFAYATEGRVRCVSITRRRTVPALAFVAMTNGYGVASDCDISALTIQRRMSDMTPEQARELQRLQAEAAQVIRDIEETVKNIPRFPPEAAKEFLKKLKDSADDFKKRGK